MGFGKMTDEAWVKSMDLNLNSHYHIISKFLPIFQKQKTGNFIHFNTIAATCALGIGNQRHGYAAGKGAAAIMTMRVGVENAKQGIRGNVIGIGYVTGPLVNRAVKNAGSDIAKVTAQRDSYVPRGYQGTPQEIANVAAFLASD